jgi:two-component system LytT family response regulator
MAYAFASVFRITRLPSEFMLRVVVVDDESIARQRICRLLAAWPDITVVAECADGREAVHVLHSHNADLVFLDVQMPEMDGFAVLRDLGADHLPLVIFVTAYEYYAVQAFEACAIDYLLKPFRRERFEQALERARQQLALRDLRRFRDRLQKLADAASEPRLAIRNGKTTLLVPHSEIDWIEAAGNYVCIHAGTNTHVARETLAGVEHRLEGTRFVRIHRSTLVNPDSVREIVSMGNGDHRVLLRSGVQVTLSRTFQDRLAALKAPGTDAARARAGQTGN